MRIFFILICIFTIAQYCVGQNLIDTSKASPKISASIQNDSSNSKEIKPKEYVTRVIITVSPEKAKDASLAVIRKTKILYSKNSVGIYPITPDTIGTWRAPLDINLASGNYNVVARKRGFREEIKEIEVANNKENNINIEMFSLSYLEHKHSQWRTAKWISGAVAVMAGIATYYFHSKINKYQDEYNNAVSPSVIQDKRNSIESARSNFRISSDIAFVALSSFGISWYLEISY